jgi:PAS domain S-box-containing protein
MPGAADGFGPAGTRPFENLLRSDPELLRSLVDQAADCVCLHEIDGRIIDVNQRMCATLGYTREELLTLTVFDIDATATVADAASAALELAPGAPRVDERVLKRKDGSAFPVELRLSIIVSGDRQLMLGLARDITDRKRAERTQEEAQRALEHRVRENEDRFRELAERGRLLAWEADAQTYRFTYVGPQAPDALGYAVEDWYRPDFWVDHLHPDDREAAVEYRRRHGIMALDYEFEYRMISADGRLVWFQDIVHVIRDEAGPLTLRGFLIDITSRKRAEEARQLLLRELDHRVKNTLATVQAVAELTLRTSTSLAAFGEMFHGRIAALARMHAAIWRNKGTPLRMRELAELSLAPFARGAERASVDGDEVTISPQTAGALGLVLHELATNAVKHGALSVMSGRVRLTWRRTGGRFCLTWVESGGPTVAAPAHRGFGSVLIQQSIPYELGGTVDLGFAASGVHCTIVLPLPPTE